MESAISTRPSCSTIILNLPDNLYENYHSLFGNLPSQVIPVLWPHLKKPQMISYNTGRMVTGLDEIKNALTSPNSVWIQEFKTKAAPPNQLPICILEVDPNDHETYDMLSAAINCLQYLPRLFTVYSDRFCLDCISGDNSQTIYESPHAIIQQLEKINQILHTFIDKNGFELLKNCNTVL